MLAQTNLHEIECDVSNGNVFADVVSASGPLALQTRVLVDAPGDGCIFHRIRAKVLELDLGVESFLGCVNASHQSRERHGRVAELFEFILADVRLRFPKRVEQTNERGSLSEIVVKIEQLKSAQSGCAQVGFDLFLVSSELKFSRGVGKIFVLLQQSMRSHRVAKDLEVAGLQVRLVKILDDVVVR